MLQACPSPPPDTLSQGLDRRAVRAAGAAGLRQCPGAIAIIRTPVGDRGAARAAAGWRNSAVAIERQWLQSWFEGTPVRIEQRSETSFSVDVPRDFCFEAGRSEVRAPLAAVLDKVAQSLQRKPALRVTWLAAPGDASAAPALAQQRAGNVRKHLLARGAAADQLAVASVTQAAAVQLRIGADAP